MKRTIIAAVFGIFAAAPAFADDANWPRTNHPNPFHSWSMFEQDTAVQYGSVTYAAVSKRPAKPAAPINPWNHDFAPFGQASSMPVAGTQSAFVPSLGTTQKELDDRARYLRSLRRESYRGTTCNSDFQPADAAAYCFNATTHRNVNAPIGASDGGGE
jgi:hypothetical protein